MTDCCPTCGALRADAAERLTSTLTLTEGRLLRIVRGAGSAGITTEAIEERMWGRANPCESLVTVHLKRINEKIAPHGWRVVARPHRGPNSRRYMERIR